MAGDTGPAHSHAPAGGPDEREIRQALDRVTSQPPLSRSNRLSGFLRYIVEETLAGRSEAIGGYSIAVDVFRKPESFDPAIDSIVRVEAGRLRKRLDEYYREAGADDPIRITLPKGSYVPGFDYQTVRRMVSAPVADRGPSIAVLPFQNYGANADDQFYADGLTEETIANLARFKDLFVFSRSTTAKMARDGADIRQFHTELGVDFVLESSVRKSPDTVRVTIQIIDAATDGHIFSEQLQRPFTTKGVFEIQDEIARLIAGRVADRYGPLGRYAARASRAGQSKRMETYLWLTRFYDYYASHLPEHHREVREGLETALLADPESSDASAALAAVYLDEYRLHLNERADFPALDRAMETALRAVSFDPDNAMAYQFLALIHYHRRDLAEFRIAAARAVELNPGHADVLADLGHCYALAGEWERGLAMIERALEISPVHPGWYHNMPAIRLLLDGDPEAGLLELKKGAMVGHYWHHALMACFLAWAGRHEDAESEVAALLDLFPDFADKARGECEIWNADEEVTEKIIQGWQKAGLAVPAFA